MADTPFGGLLEGILTGREMQEQRARALADQTFRDVQINLQVKKFRSDEEQRKIDNELAQRKQDDALMLDWQRLNEDTYQFNKLQERYEYDRKSREEVARIKAAATKDIAEAKNLSANQRLSFLEAIHNAGTPEAAMNLANYFRAFFKTSSTPTGTGTPDTPESPSDSAPQSPAFQMAPPAPTVDLNTLFGVQQVFPTAQAAPTPGGFDPSQPFGGTAGAQARSRAAYADMIKQKADHLQEQFTLDALKANASIAHSQALTEKIKAMAPIERELATARIAEIQNRIQTRAQEIAEKARNTQWEHSYKEAALDLRKRMVGGSLDSLRQRRSSAGREMVAVGKDREKLLAEVDRLTADRDRRVPSLVTGGILEGTARDQRIQALNAQLEEITTVHEAAKENYQHYTRILEETGNIQSPQKPQREPGTEKFGSYYQTPEGQKDLKDSRAQQRTRQATTPPPKPGAKGPAPVTLTNGIQMPGASVGQIVERQMQGLQSRKSSAPPKAAPAKKKETDADIMARLNKKYGIR